jgi:pimeloyl-ACP methyl ester carboxylesterase
MSNSNQNRRSFLGTAATAAATLAATQFGILGSAIAKSPSGTGRSVAAPRVSGGSGRSFGPIKQLDAGLLNIGYAEDGPADGPMVILLHGWPYDIHSFVDVSATLAAKGYRVIVPYLRGYGTTKFLSSDTFRNSQQGAIALDIIAMMDALKIEKAVIGGFDWGAREADILAALWPERFKAPVSVSGFLISTPAGNQKPLPPLGSFVWWYQFYFATITMEGDANLPQEAPKAFAQAIIDVDRF